jgi:CHASE3 domain sensor protein
MNEAEISRIVGGRSNWQSLQASVNKWQTDPSKANSITPSQRQQIRSLVQSVSQKLNVKQEALSQAAGELIDSDDPKQHRAIVQRARTILNSIDEGTQGGGNQSAPGASPQRPAGVPSGYNWNPQGNGGNGSWQPPK